MFKQFKLETLRAIGIIYFCYKEDEECFDKAQNKKTSCDGG